MPLPPPLTLAVVTLVMRPFASAVITGITVELPNVPTFEFAVASVAAVVPAGVEMSPEKLGMRAALRVPLLISEAAMLLLVSVWTSVVPTTVPVGAATAIVILGAVRCTKPFAPGSLSKEFGLPPRTAHVLAAPQP